MKITNYEFMEKYIADHYPQEAVGVIIDFTFVPLTNIADDPSNFFKVSREEFDLYRANAQALIHSHCHNKWDPLHDPRTPSYEDMLCQENMAIPFGIVHTTGEYISQILWFGTDEIIELLDRDYISNVYDCFTLARDYYRLKYDIDFGLHPRPADWEEWNPHYIEQNYRNLGFVEIDGTECEPGDIILFSIVSRNINHIGIVINDSKFIHHLFNRKSCEDKIERWSRQIVKYLRHEGK
jgi:hypothetical protein